MTDSTTIRDFLRDKPEGATAPEIARQTGASIFVVYEMHRSGMLARDGAYRQYRYTFAREAHDRRVNLTPDARRTARALRAKERLHRQGKQKPRAVYLRELAEKRASRPKAVRVRREREQAKRERAPKPIPPKTETRRRQEIIIEPARPHITKAAKPTPVRESVEDWIARTGKQPDVLPSFYQERT